MRLAKRVVVIVLLALLVVPLVMSTLPAGAQQSPSDPELVGFPDRSPDVGLPQSGAFVNVTRGLSSLGDVGGAQNVINISLQVDKNLTEFTLEIFDGDMGETWDRWWTMPYGYDDLTFSLYRDPNVDAQGGPEDLMYTWPASEMPDDAWCALNPDYATDQLVCKPGAKMPQDGSAYNEERDACYYHLVAEWVEPQYNNEQNNFKVRVQGVPFLLAGSTIGFEGFSYYYDDGITWTQCPNYTGEFTFYFLVPPATSAILLYDGDADLVTDTNDGNTPDCRGPYVGSVDYNGDGVNDTAEDPDSNPTNGPWYTHWYINEEYVKVCTDPEFPPFQTSPQTFAEDAIPGSPPDNTGYFYFKVPPNVRYEVISPGGGWTRTNWDVSGDQEWEVFKIEWGSSIPDPDVTVPTMPAGLYKWHFVGLDSHNTMFIHTGFDVFSQLATLGNTVWYDANEDGVWAQTADEPGIAGVKVNLYRDANADQMLDAGDELLGSQWTDSTGYYIFTGLDWADYLVQVDPGNFAPGGPLEGLFQTSVFYPESSPDHHNRVTPWPVHIPVSLNYVKADFGYFSGEDFCFYDSKECENGATGDWGIKYDAQGNPESVTMRTILNRTFADTAWGTNSVATGWPGGGRKFKQIWTSDNLEMRLYNGDGDEVMELGIDLLEDTDDLINFPSGFASAGVDGGDGYLSLGNRAHILRCTTSISEILNAHANPVWGSACYWDQNNCPVVSVLEDGTYDSPCEDWIWDTWYEIEIDYAAFGPSGFGGIEIWALHSSPSKTGDRTPRVQECPEGWIGWWEPECATQYPPLP